MSIRLVVYLLAFGILLSTQWGCATTSVWQEAARKEMYYPHITGVVRDDPQDPARPSALVVQYLSAIGGNNITRYYCVIIPLDDRGLPPAIFQYRGKERTKEAIDRDLTDPAKDAVANYCFDKENFARAEVVMRSPAYMAFPPFKEILGPDSGAAIDNWKIAAFGIRNDGMPVGEQGPGGVDRFPDGIAILLLPSEQPRPASEMVPATTFAWIATPFTVAFDILTFPAQFAWRVTHC